ncbi:prepilin-type N-terminal cleavage/methylation domain-containing protein [Tissierella sp.]|uniref:prepilin-type N-terminal cleavage/methylation domain-containing protein n=1 Tax=Tissierella sp. TaxID=41274 RepID=UPI0028AE3F77|nr:prepilin-type N-terminal cleavage/methylation domain-containing protein [Tissierella sp.]
MKRGINLNKKGFTLVETILGLFLLGLIAVTVLPIINTAFIRIESHKIKMEMVYLGEMSMEKIKAFDASSKSDLFIYDTNISEVIKLFKEYDDIEINIPKKENDDKYYLKISKNQRMDSLWIVSISVFHNKKGSNIKNVEYKAYMPPK